MLTGITIALHDLLFCVPPLSSATGDCKRCGSSAPPLLHSDPLPAVASSQEREDGEFRGLTLYCEPMAAPPSSLMPLPSPALLGAGSA